ncbi:MAG: hypothetical protein MK110_14410 [Fuerstiella sp.]|nr:hypothetical protein [Fuerstiella sp.]
MEEYRQGIVVTCVLIYMIVCIAVGLWAMKRTRDSGDFFMAGRHLGAFVTSMAVFSSTLSGFGFVGGPELVYRMGMSSIWMVVSVTIGYTISFFLLGKRLRLFAEVHQPLSLPDVIAARYGNQSTRLLASIAILGGVVGYLASQMKAMAVVLRSIIEENTVIMGVIQNHAVLQALLLDADGTSVTMEATITIGCVVLVFYCVTGGIIASVYTDVFQGLIMIIAAILVFLTAATTVDGGFTEMSRTIMADDPEAMGPWGTLGMMGCLSWYFLFALGGAGQPQVVTKIMMNRRVKDARTILPLSMVGYTVSALLWLSIGLAMRTVVLQGRYPELESSGDAATAFLQTYAHPLLAGVVFAGLFAAIMSTADGFLSVGTAALVHDIPKSVLGRPLKNELLWARIATLVLAVAASVFALKSGISLIALLGAYGWGIFASTLVPAVAIGLNWKRGTALAANCSIIAALTVNVSVLLCEQKGIRLPWGLNGGAVALLVSLTVYMAISFCSRAHPLPKDVEIVMDV